MAQQGPGASRARTDGWRSRLLGIGVTAGAVALGVVHALWPHLKIDSVTAVLVVIALVPWIGGLVSDIELPGFKVSLREVREAAATAQEAAVTAKEAAVTAETRADVAASTATAAMSAATAPRSQSVSDLAEEFVRVREDTPAGSQRTSELDRLFGRMATATANDPDFDFPAQIHATHPGLRLAALSYAFVQPEPGMMPEVFTVVTHPNSSFEQYWSLQALTQVLGSGARLDDAMAGSLRDIADQLPATSSRLRFIRQIFAKQYPGG